MSYQKELNMKTAKKIDYQKIEMVKKQLNESKYLDKAIKQLAHEISSMFT